MTTLHSESHLMTKTDTVSISLSEETADFQTPDMTSAKLKLLTRMANAWFEKGELRQATDAYLKIIEEYPDSLESRYAQTVLLKLAQRYEQEGLWRLSMDVLERLEQAV